MVRPTKIRPGRKFLELRNNMKINLSQVYGRKISDPVITDGIADFITSEGLDEMIIRKAKYQKRRGGFF